MVMVMVRDGVLFFGLWLRLCCLHGQEAINPRERAIYLLRRGQCWAWIHTGDNIPSIRKWWCQPQGGRFINLTWKEHNNAHPKKRIKPAGWCWWYIIEGNHTFSKGSSMSSHLPRMSVIFSLNPFASTIWEAFSMMAEQSTDRGGFQNKHPSRTKSCSMSGATHVSDTTIHVSCFELNPHPNPKP